MLRGLLVLLIVCQIWLSSVGASRVLVEGSCEEDNGGCDQECIQRDAGGHYCDCSIPGYQIQEDGTTCTAVSFCEVLGQNATDGVLDCRYTASTNGWICYTVCNAGYFFVSGENNYVTCGVETRWKWSHQLANETAELQACMKEFFVDTKLVVHYDYELPEDGCRNLDFFSRPLSSITKQGIQGLPACTGRCWVSAVDLECPDEDARRPKLQVTATIFYVNGNQEAVGPECSTSCRILNTRQMLGETLAMLTAVEESVVNIGVDVNWLTGPESPSLDVDSFYYDQPRLLCKVPGRVLTSKFFCVPCAPGTYLVSPEDHNCTPCPVGTFQRFQGGAECQPCPRGSTTVGTGASHSTECSVRVS